MKNKNVIPDAVCGTCGKPIFLRNEVDHILFNSRGVPICAVCRVLRTPPKKLIKAREKFEKDLQKQANDNIIDVAIISQEEEKKSEKRKRKTKK